MPPVPQLPLPIAAGAVLGIVIYRVLAARLAKLEK